MSDLPPNGLIAILGLRFRPLTGADVTPAQLDRFVAGERDLTLATAAKVAAALGLALRPARR